LILLPEDIIDFTADYCRLLFSFQARETGAPRLHFRFCFHL